MLLGLILFVAPSKAAIHYTVSVGHPEQHLFHVTMEIPDVSGEVIVQMPAWNALYQIRDFAMHVQRVEALTNGQPVRIEKLDKQTWRITANGTVTVRYDTFWDDGGPFGTQLNGEVAFINPAMICMYVPNRRNEEVRIYLNDLPYGWGAASGAPFRAVFESGRIVLFTFGADSYDEMTDAPIQAGRMETFDVPDAKPPVHVFVLGDDWRKKVLQEELRRVVAYEVKLMEGAPYKEYTFLLRFGKSATGEGGGMEHMDSTAISVRSDEDFANIGAHEFFHLWNVKRIHPAAMDPIDFTKEQDSRAFWFAEGVTNTYASYTMVRTGLWNKAQFYDDFSQQVGELESRPANHWQSAEQSSLDAWFEKYPLYNRPTNSISYYTKGQVLGFLLDILIRDRTDDEHSLDDVMRSMNEEFGKTGKGYRDSLDVRQTAEKVAGGSFEEFFDRYVAAADPLPYRDVLAKAGLALRTDERKHASLGFSVERENGALTVESVDPESAAEAAGLRRGDVVVSWNGAEPPRGLERWANTHKKGTSVKVGVRREDGPATVEFVLGEVSETFYHIVEDEHGGEKARRIREGILRGTTQPVTAVAH
ncbi:MAG TPA: PDZ domain-containing protein [Candidatus Sulfotelmatobacter sp.]|nr:PDZ domain-containing protein [Candidatus Sulfotelmatobacter sp.]